MKPLLISILCMASYGVSAADWVDDWFDNAVYDKPSSYNSQKRGYYSAGGFSARVNSTTDYPISITPPRLNVGCGGIDAFLGGVSFLDKDFLVDKTQAIMQAAPYVALDMAMKTMCKECSDTLAKAEQAVNFLNGLQINECQMAKPIVTAALDKNPEALKGLWTEMTGTQDLDEAKTRMWGETTNDIKAANGTPTTDLKALTDGCPVEFKEIFKNGSVIERVSEKLGMKDYADTIRGYIGDVIIYSGSSDKIPQSRRMMRCGENDDVSIDDMLHGRSYIKNAAGVCSRSSSGGVYSIVESKLTKISAAIGKGDRISSQDEKFIFATPYLPVYSMLMQASMENTSNEMISILTDLVALHYTYIIFNDLYRNADFALRKAEEMMNEPGGNPGSTKKCRTDLYLPAISKFKDVLAETTERRTVMEQKYNARLTEIQNNLDFSDTIRAREERYRKESATIGVK